MRSDAGGRPWTRRARPLLGTLVEVGVRAGAAAGSEAVRAAFDAIAEVQACLSRFESTSDIARFHALPQGASLEVNRHTAEVLSAAQRLNEASAGIFDISLCSAPDGWRCDGMRLWKLNGAIRLDLGGIGKGYAVDRGVEALIARGCSAGWVNAGGDMRAFGEADIPVWLRDEVAGRVRPFATLKEGALATSHFHGDSRSRAAGFAHEAGAVHAHASVAAPLCLWADALTKVVAISGDAAHPLLAQYAAQAWLH